MILIWLIFSHCTHNKILLKMSDGNRKPTDVEMFLPKPVEKNNQTGNCTMWLHLYSKPSLVQLVAYAFPWFIKFHGFMILTGTTKIGIQQIKLSIHTIREILRIIHLFHISYKFVIWISYHFIITVCYIVHNTNLLLSTRIKYIPHLCHG